MKDQIKQCIKMIHNGKMLSTFPLRLGTKQDNHSLCLYSIFCWIDNSSAIRQEEKINGRKIGQEKKTTQNYKRLLREILEELSERMYQIQSLKYYYKNVSFHPVDL